jgi:putative AbiEi antitoxin of type IV toxin-antitoxin system
MQRYPQAVATRETGTPAHGILPTMTQPLYENVPALLDDRFPLPVDAPFTAGQARRAGVGPNALTRLVTEGLLRRPLKGVYVAAQVPDSLALRVRVLSLVVPRGSAATDWTACWLHTGISAPGGNRKVAPISVFRPSDRGRLRNGLCTSGERAFFRGDLVPVGGTLLATSPLRTAWDLGRFAPPVVALGGIDALLRVGGHDREQLLAGVERFRRQRGVVQLRTLAALADPRSESPGESALRLRWLETAEMPQPQLQIPVTAPDGFRSFRLDLGVEELRFAAEYDGERFHGPEAATADRDRRAILDVELGWTVLVFRRDDVYGPTQQAGRLLRRGLLTARARAGAFRVGPDWP